MNDLTNGIHRIRRDASALAGSNETPEIVRVASTALLDLADALSEMATEIEAIAGRVFALEHNH
jgi:hypothetical protein